MKKITKISILTIFAALSVSAISAAIIKNVSSDIEHYVCEVPKEIQGLHFNKLKTPTDNKYNTQKSYSMSTLGDIESVWDNYTGKGTTVAIIDDGFDHDHPEYTRKDGTSAISSLSRYYYENSAGTKVYYKEYSTTPTCIDEDWEEDDYYGDAWATHGTNTSTSAAAPIDNGGTVGIAPDATILALKIDMSFSAIKEAINYAIDCGVDVINMSLGAYASDVTDGFGDKQTGYSSIATYLNTVCDLAYSKDIIVVASAGNEATSAKSYPACNNHVIGVGALGKNTVELAGYTNFNSSTTQGDEKNVDILAPGTVYTASITGTSSSSHTTTYEEVSGTSFSSPIIAGTAALWKQKNPEGKPDQFLKELQETADDIGGYATRKVDTTSWGGSKKYTANIACGRLNVASLMNQSNDVQSITLDKTSITLASNVDSKKTATLKATITPSNADELGVIWSIDNSNVATLSSTETTSGNAITVTAKSNGNATITAKSKANNEILKTCSIKVEDWISVTGVTLVDNDGNTSGTISRGKTIQLNATILPANASNKTYIIDSNNTTVATVDDSGLVKGIKAGAAEIVALTEDGDFEATYTLTVTSPDNLSTFLINCYDATTLSDTTGESEPYASSFKDKITVDGVINNDILSSISDQRNAYFRRGGLTLGTSKDYGEVTFKVNSDYAVSKVTVVGAYADTTGTLYLNDEEADSGDLNSKGSTLADCSKSLIWDNLEYITTLTFTVDDSYSRVAIYTIECEFADDTPKKTVKSVYLTGVPSTTKLYGTFDTSNIKLMAIYDDKSESEVAPSSKTFTVDNTKLGKQTISASYNGFEATSEVFVTNNGVTNVGEGKDTNYSVTFTNNKWAYASGGVPVSATNNGNTFLNDGVQLTKGNSTTLSTDKSYDNISSITVDYCTNKSSGAGTITAKVGTTSLNSKSLSSSGGTSKRSVTFTCETVLTGKISLAISCSTNSIYIIGFSFQSKSAYDASYEDQAKAWATYFSSIIKPSCSVTGIGSDIASITTNWTGLKEEFNYMLNGSKTALMESADSTIVDALTLYTIIIQKYDLDNFIKDENDTFFIKDNSNNVKTSTSESVGALIIIFTLTSITALGMYFKKKKALK